MPCPCRAGHSSLSRFTGQVPRPLLPLVLIATLAISGCTAEPHWKIGADGSCDPAQLQVKVVARVDADPALVAVDVLLTNVSGTACQLFGVPTVVITDAYETAPIGGQAIALDGTPASVPLAPKAAAYFLVETLQALQDTPTCVGVTTNGMHIVLPGRADATAIVTSSPVAKYCDEPSRRTLLVSAFTAEPLVVPGIENFVPAP
ncbi:MAG: hypothetical protein JWP19_121 [Rhodoglobus sp.]|nr:hypothetical protein [Rhodoglobus sp.]